MVHSNFDPSKEAGRIFERLRAELSAKVSCLICFGFGCGHFIRKILEYKPSPFQEIICLEPAKGSLALPEIQKEVESLKKLAVEQKISLHISDDLDFTKPSNFLFYSLPYYSRNYPEEWRSLDNFLKRENESIATF